MEKRYYWIKLKTDFFNQEAIDFLMAQENGCEYIVLYQMLCLKTANSNGEMTTKIGEMIVPYDVKKIVRDTKYFDADTVMVAMELFKKLGLIYEEENQILKISNYKDMIGSETSSAKRVREYRERQALQCNTTETLQCNTDVTQENRYKILDIRDKEKEKEKDKEKRKVNYQLIADMYNETCVSFPKVTALSDSRKKSIKARLKTYSIDDFKTLFEKAESSSFLKGGNNRNWTANFDWLIKDSNMAKVLDGNYDNNVGATGVKLKKDKDDSLDNIF